MPDRIRILLPVRPENDCSQIAKLLDQQFGHETVTILRLFVYRPAELDIYAPEMLASVPLIRRLDEEEVAAARSNAQSHCNGLVQQGFDVESAVVDGFPVETVLDETRSWRADLIVVHLTHQISHETRIGQLAGALIDGSPVPVLAFPQPHATGANRIAVHVDLTVENDRAMQWADALATKTDAEIDLVHVRVPHRWGRTREEAEVRRDLETFAATVNRPVRIHIESAPNISAGLTAVVDRCNSSLVVVASHHDIAPSLLGSTDRRIVGRSDIPVLIVPRDIDTNPARVRAILASPSS